MKILILTCNTGQGHNSAAAAIKEALEHKGIECGIADTIAFMSRLGSKIIEKSFTGLYRNLPKAWDMGYSSADNNGGILSEVDYLMSAMSIGAGRLLRYVNKNNYSHIVCVHIFSAIMVTVMKKRCKHYVSSSFLATDYTCYPYTENTDIDTYFIPHKDTADLYLSKGIAENKLVTTGIPIRKSFFQSKEDKADARRALGLPDQSKVVLIMGGSMGCGPIKDLVAAIGDRCGNNLRILISCGTNDRLLSNLKKRDDERIIPFGYSDNVPQIMIASDLFITKPGGISITEAALMGLPTLLVNMVGGCETYNYEFFTSRHLAFGAKDIQDAANLCAELLEDSDLLQKQSYYLRSEFKLNSAEIICGLLKNFLVNN